MNISFNNGALTATVDVPADSDFIGALKALGDSVRYVLGAESAAEKTVCDDHCIGCPDEDFCMCHNDDMSEKIDATWAVICDSINGADLGFTLNKETKRSPDKEYGIALRAIEGLIEQRNMYRDTFEALMNEHDAYTARLQRVCDRVSDNE